jgi:hypothetical protein
MRVIRTHEMAEANEHIPVTEDRFEELGDLKQAGQTWDELLGELTAGYRNARFRREISEIRERGEFTPLDEAGR